MTPSPVAPLDRPGALAVGDTDLIQTALETARDLLGMPMAYLADTRAGLQDYRAISGDGESFGALADEPISLEGTYCGLLLDGAIDGLVPDTQADPRVARLPITLRAEIGAYVGVPVQLPSGSLFGTFCCLSHDPDPTLRGRDLDFMRVLARMVGEQLHREQIMAEDHRRALNDAHVIALLVALEARDGYTEQHSHEVVTLALSVARRMDMDPDAISDVRAAALLHDVGKIGISDAVLRKPGKLTPQEWNEMRRHPVIGERMVASMPGLSHLAPVVRAEHERWDGAGYPDGLSGEEIPLISRIVLVCDAYHAMTSDRPYRVAMPTSAAREELRAHAGTQFCPRTVKAAVEVLGGANK